VRLRVAEKRATKKPDRGILTLALQVINQKGEVIQEGTNLLMVRARAA